MLGKHHPRIALPLTWILQLQGFEFRSQALELSFTALSPARVAWRNNNMVLLCQSRSIYLSALQQLRLAIANRGTRLSDETLAARLALSTYELIGCPCGHLAHFLPHYVSYDDAPAARSGCQQLSPRAQPIPGLPSPSLYWPELSTLKSFSDAPEPGKCFSISFRFPTSHIDQTVVMY